MSWISRGLLSWCADAEGSGVDAVGSGADAGDSWIGTGGGWAISLRLSAASVMSATESSSKTAASGLGWLSAVSAVSIATSTSKGM